MLSLMLLEAAAQRGAEPVTASEFMIHAYTSVIIALLGVIASLLSYLQARAAAKHAGDAKHIVDEVQIKLNGRLDELLERTREAGHQHGRAEGIMEERMRRQSG